MAPRDAPAGPGRDPEAAIALLYDLLIGVQLIDFSVFYEWLRGLDLFKLVPRSNSEESSRFVAGAGFEPTTFRL
jgi:hypothetical protein